MLAAVGHVLGAALRATDRRSMDKSRLVRQIQLEPRKRY